MNVELFLIVLPKIILIQVITYYCLCSVFAAIETGYEMESRLAFYVALLVSATVGLLIYPMLLLAKLSFKMRRISRFSDSHNSIRWVYAEAILETTKLIFTKTSELSEFAKLRFTKHGRAKRQRMLREELWNNEFYCGED